MRLVFSDTITEAQLPVVADALKSALATKPGMVALIGELGAGKSTLVRSFLTALGVTGVIPSPSYCLMQEYETTLGLVEHWDIFRLSDAPNELLQTQSIALVEWADRAPSLFQKCGYIVELRASSSIDKRVVLIFERPVG